MKAVFINKFGPPDVLEIGEVERPAIGDEEVLVRVHYASVNPVDWKVRNGSLRILTGSRFPMLLGLDIAGEVAETGLLVSRFKRGDRVFGALSYRRRGAYAEFAAASEKNLAGIPEDIDYASAAALPIAGLTAYQGLHYKGKIKSGDAVLVNGASGGVGSFAVQIAKAAGATVTGVCSSGNAGLVRESGADRVIDYSKQDFAELPEKYDLIFDAVGKLSFLSVSSALKEGGRYVGTLPNSGSIIGYMLIPLYAALGYRKRPALINVKPDAADLEKLAVLVEERKVVPRIDRFFTLDEIREAHSYSETGHARGKILIKTT